MFSLLLTGLIVTTSNAKAQILPGAPSNYSVQFYYDVSDMSRQNGVFTSGPTNQFDLYNPAFHADLNVTYNLKDFRRNLDQHDLNDHASSAVLNGDAGIKVTLYNNPSGQTDDDWTEITFKQYLPNYYLVTFDGTWEDEWIKVVSHKDHSGLNGHVSAIRITK